RPGLIAATDQTVAVTPTAGRAETAHAAGATNTTSGAVDGGAAPEPPAAAQAPTNELTRTVDTGGPHRSTGLRRRWAALAPRTRLILAGVAGALSGLSGIGLTVAASWLIVRAESQP